VASLVITNCLPLSFVESVGFRQFCDKVINSYVPPCSKTLKSKFIFPMATKLRAHITEMCANKSFALTTDLWSSIKMDSFLGLTLHCVIDHKKHNFVLECAPFLCAHDNINIREKVIEILNNYSLKLSDCVSITRDNAPNMKKAFDEGQFEDIFNFPCVCHSLNLIFTDVFVLRPRN
jgi:hypothetical protein